MTKLTPNTTYFFRACGQDTNDAGPTCAGTLSFKTLAGTSYAFDGKWPTTAGAGTASGRFNNPQGVATDLAGNVYVADTINNRIQKFTSTGGFLRKWGANGGDGSSGTANGQFDRTEDVATDAAGNFYVSDANTGDNGGYPGNRRVQKFNAAGNFVTKWGPSEGTAGELFCPAGIEPTRAATSIRLTPVAAESRSSHQREQTFRSDKAC